MKKKIKLILGNLTILLFTTVLCLLLGELVTRILISTKNITILTTPPIVKDEEAIYKNAPNWKGKIGFSSKNSYKVTLNSRGLNEREFNFKKQKNTNRILFLGDSITFGLGIDVDKTFVRIVENLLNFHLSYNPILSEVKRVETFNGGVSGYYTWQEIALLRKTGLKYHPDIVFLDFYLNDVEPFESEQEIKEFRESQFAYLRSKYAISLPFKDFLREKSRLYWMSRKVYNLMVIKLFSAVKHSHITNVQDTSSISFDNRKIESNEFLHLAYLHRLDWGAPWNSNAYYTNFRNYIKELKNISQKENFKLVIMFFPVKYQLDINYLEDEPQRRLIKIAEEEGILFLDLLPLMRDCKILPESLYSDWCHLTPEGHKFVAEKVYQFLITTKII